MLSGKLLIVLAAMVAVVMALCNMNMNPTVEGFWMSGGRKWKTMPTVQTSPGCPQTATTGNFVGNLGDDRFVKTPSFQALLSPRFNNMSTSAHLRYNPAPEKYQASRPCDPLMTGAMAQENYEAGSADSVEGYPTSCGGAGCNSGGCSAKCGAGGSSVPSMGGNPMHADYAAGDYNKKVAEAHQGGPEVTSQLPMGTMSTVDAEGNQTNPVVYQNFIFANQKSRLRALGDPIRGDLPIVPCSGSWFSVHPNVGLDLQEGAMNVLAGNSNQTARATAQLITAANGVVSPIAGDPEPFAGLGNMTPQYATGLSAGGSDVVISGMP